MLKLLFAVAFVASFQVRAQNLKLFVGLNPAGDFVAESDQVTGQAVENPDGSVEATNIRVPAKSLKSGINLRDEHMTNKYLEADKYPDIILKVAKGKDGKGLAILIIKGKEGKVSGTYAKSATKLKANFSLKISDFNIKDISYKGIGVEDEVKVEVIVPLVKASQAKPAPAKAPAKAPARKK
jgi:polyisoprenoid-binding protein YceI